MTKLSEIDLIRAKELLQEFADAAKQMPELEKLREKAIAFLNRRRRSPLTPKD